VRRTTAKARRATGFVRDAFDNRWDISEFRGTKHGFDIVLGWPSGKPRGMGGAGRPGVILTPALVRYLELFRTNMKGIDLPISPNVIVRLRGLLGHDTWKEVKRWWEDRRADLKALSYAEFARRHACTPSAARLQGAKLNGERHKQKLWWTTPDVLSVLASKKPDAEVAAALNMSPNSLRRLRSKCRKMGLGAVALRLRPRLWWKAPEVLAVLRSGGKSTVRWPRRSELA
jgi:hypothetical protein